MKILLKYGWEKAPNWEYDVKLAGKKQNIDPRWKIPMKDVDLGEPTSFLDHVHMSDQQGYCG